MTRKLSYSRMDQERGNASTSDRYRMKGPHPLCASSIMTAPQTRLQPRFLPVGDTGLSVEFGAQIEPAANDAVTALDHAIATSNLQGIVETVPSFRSLLVIYEPALIDRQFLLESLRKLTRRAARAPSRSGRRWSIPTVYRLPFGEDLGEVAKLLGRDEQDIVSVHTATEFRVYMLGFQPGLPNLGGLPPELHISRRITPRAPVPGGSVMIGGVQGAIMPMPTPSGLYLLGRTPIRLFDQRRPEPALLRPGDILRFRQIERAEFAAIEAAIMAGDLDAGATLEFEAA